MIKIKIYLDLVFVLNFIIDLVLLILVSLILKRKVKFIKFILGSLFGSFSILALFIRFNSLELFIYKLLISVFMILITFGFKDIKNFIKNLYYLYMTSMLLGGIMYFINNNYNQVNNGILLFNYSGLNIVFILIIGLVIIYIYTNQIKDLKINYNNYYDVELNLKGKNLLLTGFLDTGNKLIDPYKKRPIILVNEKLLNITDEKILYVPFSSVNKGGLLKCIKVDNIYIEGKIVKKKFLVGLMGDINIDGVDCILNSKIMEE